MREVDIKENYINQLDKNLLKILLKDRSSHQNIIWATENYISKGEGFSPCDYITIKAITAAQPTIKPRVEKSKTEQNLRIKEKAEVFTPSWVCNLQNNLIDSAWFGRKDVFNIEKQNSWLSSKQKVVFPTGKSWQDYVCLNRIEFSCGEAPYLVSRYDAARGQWFDIDERIGLLDRKFRIINENTKNEEEWYEWAVKAFKSIFGFEWQGDSLFIARENLLFTFIDYYIDRFEKFPSNEYLKEIAKIISWNIFQMDGFKFIIPFSDTCSKAKNNSNFSLKGPLKQNLPQSGIFCKIMNWKTGKAELFIKQLKRKAHDR